MKLFHLQILNTKDHTTLLAHINGKYQVLLKFFHIPFEQIRIENGIL